MTVTWFPPYVARPLCTADRMAAAELMDRDRHELAVHLFIIERQTHLDWASAKPSWTVMSELKPGKRVESKGLRIMLASVSSERLKIIRKTSSCQQSSNMI